MKRTTGWMLGAVAWALAMPAFAENDEPASASSPSAAQLAVWDSVHFTSSAEIVDVIDAFDEDDPFDFNLSVAYQWAFRRAKISRECRERALCDQDRTDGYARQFIDYLDLARYEQTVHTLDLLAVFGLYHDLQLYTRWPLVLSDSRSVTTLEGGPDLAHANAFIDGLFELPFDSPERSGVDYFTVGLSWEPFNQERDPTDPNWVLNIEGRFGVGDILRASTRAAGDGGISRGVNELRFATYLSRRYRWIEPYTGLTAMIGFPKSDAPFHYRDYANGQINRFPPIEGSLLFGMEIIPWENLERLQKFSIGLQLLATYHSEGRSYSELFDALGTSEDPRLTYGYDRDTNTYVDRLGPAGWDWYDDGQYTFSGMTDTENYATIEGRLTLMIQAAKYVKFAAGVGFAHDTEHYITYTDECNADVSGGCQYDSGTGSFGPQYNPMTRDVIDAPGNRFRVQETTIFDVFVNVTAMF